MMQLWMDANPEAVEEAGLYPEDGETAADMAFLLGSDDYTWENIIISAAGCAEDFAEESAATLMAASATVLAVALLN